MELIQKPLGPAGDRLEQVPFGLLSALASYRCSSDSSNRGKLKLIKRHEKFDFKYDDIGLNGWAKYDISLFSRKDANLSADPIQILNDKAQITSLISQGKCIVVGSGNSLGSLTNKDILAMPAPPVSSINLETHIIVTYEGKALLQTGDSGGPLLCQQDQSWALAGLMEYAGLSTTKAGAVSNIVGIMLIRPDLVEWIKANTSM